MQVYYWMVFFGICILLVSGFSIYIFLFFRRLTKGVKEGNLIKVLDKLIELGDKNSKGLRLLEKKVDQQIQEGYFHIQKVALIRFNPFGETGGDYSFSLALLNGRDTGIIITGLHTRERTRIYIKEILDGKSKVELSKEEKKALLQAQKSR